MFIIMVQLPGDQHRGSTFEASFVSSGPGLGELRGLQGGYPQD
jgi:hypothetical protein